ncbi:hydroxyacid dehydrogenase [Archaeoglobus neptunius]|uniref:hydroxyacid dehydrogenase n=1 Tax=Archaeoglobus neptunius TaxID=2798580 RepID=UPI001926A269|nr:hydroxyacid dehydrogenase [Archaeoglobus neptunius]
MPKILLTSHIDELIVRELSKLGNVRISPDVEEEVLAEEVKDADVLVARVPALITEKIIENGKKLKGIVRWGVGYDNIDVEAARKRGIVVAYTPGTNTVSVAEYVICTMLALAKKLHTTQEEFKKGNWDYRLRYDGTEIYGKSAGILGLGRIGAEVARLCRCFNMQVLYYDVLRRRQIEKELGVRYEPLTDDDRRQGLKVPGKILMVDYLIIQVPLTTETKGIIGRREIEKMKKGIVIINAARGGVLDEKALYEGLINGKISGAALDVFEEEPPESELYREMSKMDNVILTPHIAGITVESRKRMSLMVVEEVKRILSGERPLNPVF